MQTAKLNSLLLVLAIFSVACSNKTEQSLLRPPFEQVTLPWVSIAFDPAQGDTLVLENGTRLEVPANAFIRPDGSQPIGEVTLKYREMHKTEDILISGIPLNTWQDGEMNTLESAVMWEVRAFQDSISLELDSANNKMIKTVIASDVEDPDFDLYFLDEKQQQWDWKSEITPEQNTLKLEAYQRSEEAAQRAKDYDLKNCFAINYVEFIDIKNPPRDRVFNYFSPDKAPSSKTVRRLMSQKLKGYGADWLDAFGYVENEESIRYSGKECPPALLLWEAEGKIPVWINNDSDWIRVAFKKIKEYRYKLTFWKWGRFQNGNSERNILYSMTAKIKMSLKELYASQPEAWSEEYLSLLEQAEVEKKFSEAQNLVTRTFKINQMGIYNYDIPLSQNELLVQAEFSIPDQELYPDMDIYVIPGKANSVVRYSQASLGEFRLYPNTEMLIFSVMMGNQIARVDPEKLDAIDYSQLSQGGKREKVHFDLVPTGIVVEDVSDVQEFLQQNQSVEEFISLQ
ncbi:MAG: hypothetical protein WA958_07670 [Tunicatimonas sp.]